MDNSINFKGAFLIKPTTQAIKRNLSPIQDVKNNLSPVLEKKKKQIIENVTSNGDILYVVRNGSDKAIADVLLGIKNIEFKYYPSLNTKSGFDDQAPHEAQQILRSASKKFISTKQKLENYFKPKLKRPFDIMTLQANNLKIIQKETFTDITGSNYKTNIDHQKGICSVYTMVRDNKTGKNIRHTLINITPPDKFGISYARYTPITEYKNVRMVAEDKNMRRFAIKNGEVIFEYTQPGSEVFIKNEAAAKKHYIEVMTKYKADLANCSNA